MDADRTEDAFREPKMTPSVPVNTLECLRGMLMERAKASKLKPKSLLISTNSLSNRFIINRWGIRPSQRKRYKYLFASVRMQCRGIFRHFIAKGRIEWDFDSESYLFGVYKFDEIRGNLILGFVAVSPDAEWTLPTR